LSDDRPSRQVAAPGWGQRDLERLAWKYRQLAALRARREELERSGASSFDEAEAKDRKRAFRRVAREFPGALRELDSLPASALRARTRAVEAAARGGPIDPWIPLALDFHALVRTMLTVRRWIALRQRTCGVVPAEVEVALRVRMERLHRHRGAHVASAPAVAFVGELLAELRREGDPVVPSGGMLTLVARPPGGRLLDLAWRRLELHHGRPRAELESLLFGGGPR